MKGFTLLEAIICLIIFSILLSLAVPAYHSMVEHYRADLAIKQLRHAIFLARSEAVQQQKAMRLVPVNGNWRNGYELTADQTTLYTFPGLQQPGAELIWQSFPAYSYLQVTAMGSTYYQNGTFSYLSPQGKVIKKLIINQAGRVRIE